MRITLYFLLAYLAHQKNNDQKTALVNKMYGGGEYLEFLFYIPFQEFSQVNYFIPIILLTC